MPEPTPGTERLPQPGSSRQRERGRAPERCLKSSPLLFRRSLQYSRKPAGLPAPPAARRVLPPRRGAALPSARGYGCARQPGRLARVSSPPAAGLRREGERTEADGRSPAAAPLPLAGVPAGRAAAPGRGRPRRGHPAPRAAGGGPAGRGGPPQAPPRRAA